MTDIFENTVSTWKAACSVEGCEIVLPVVPPAFDKWLRCKKKNHQNSGILKEGMERDVF